MPPSERDSLAPDSFPSASETAPSIKENPPYLPEAVPSFAPHPVSEATFENAPAPTPALLSPVPPSFPSPFPSVSTALPPLARPVNGVNLDAPYEVRGRIPRWRWAMSLLLIGFYPAFVSLVGELLSRHSKHKGGSALPSSSANLVIYVLLDLAVFGVFWGLGWLFSRATKDELLLRWRGGFWKPIAAGFGYALGIRLAIVVAFAFLFFLATIALAVAGHDPKTLTHLIEGAAPKTDALFPKGALANPIYLLLTITLLSFVAAGGREELWRTACLAALRHLLPNNWAERARWIGAIALSSVIFGLGHIYQGGLGVVITGFIGAGLGVLTWRNRSIWPSMWAHGFFDATSFLLAAMAAKKVIPMPTWFGW